MSKMEWSRKKEVENNFAEKIQDKIDQGESFGRWMYVKYVKWIPVIYCPLIWVESMVSIYVKSDDGIPRLQDKMIQKLKRKYAEDEWIDPDHLIKEDSERLFLKAGKEVQEMRKLFWDTAIELSWSLKFPFVVRIKPIDKKRIKPK